MYWILAVVAGAYTAIAILVYGLDYAYWQRHWPDLAEKFKESDKQMAFVSSLIWPVIMIAWAWEIANGSFKGFKGLKYKD